MQGLGSERLWNQKGAFTLSAGLVPLEAVICFDNPFPPFKQASYILSFQQTFTFLTFTPWSFLVIFLPLLSVCVLVRFEKGGLGYGGIQRQPVLSGGTFSLSESVAWLEGLLAALDCYNWVLREQLIAPSEVLHCKWSYQTWFQFQLLKKLASHRWKLFKHRLSKLMGFRS